MPDSFYVFKYSLVREGEETSYAVGCIPANRASLLFGGASVWLTDFTPEGPDRYVVEGEILLLEYTEALENAERMRAAMITEGTIAKDPRPPAIGAKGKDRQNPFLKVTK